MNMNEFEFHDLGLRVYHSEIHLTRELNFRLMERLEPYFNAQSQKADQFTFSATEKKTAGLSPGMLSISDIFDESPKVVVRRVFEILQRIVSTAHLPDVIAYDMVVSAVFSPKGRITAESLLGMDDFIGQKFLRDIDFSPLDAEDRTAGVHWVYRRGEKTYTLRIEPYTGHPDQIFIDMVVQFPEEQASVLEMKSAVEEELAYFASGVLAFLRSKAKR